MAEAPKINIDGKDYTLDDLPEAARAQLQNIQFTDQEIQRLQIKLAIAQTARSAYVQTLQAAMEDDGA